MSALKKSGKAMALGLMIFAAFAAAEMAPAPVEIREWRFWTDGDGTRIEAYLKEVNPTRAVIVRRDGRQFAAPLERFSERDRLYISQWARNHLPNAEAFQAIDFPARDLPERYRIENVERRRPGAGEPLEPAAIKMVLDYHGVRYDETLADRISVREIHRDEFIPPRDLVNALKNIPVEAEIFASWDPYDPDHEEIWHFALRMIKTAISMDLPVLVGYRPDMEIDTPELVGVAVGFDRRNLEIIEPTGSRHPTRFHLRNFEFMFAYAMILFPTFEPPLPPVEEMRIEADFLNLVSATIRDVPVPDAWVLTELLWQRGIDATVQDVNRTDYRFMLGKTRSFARRGGLPIVDAALNHGRVVIVPREYDRDSNGFALIYGRVGDLFATVEFFPDGTFERGFLSRPDLARNWLTRADRIYRLDLIQIVVPLNIEEPPPRLPRPPPRPPPPSEPPAPPRY